MSCPKRDEEKIEEKWRGAAVKIKEEKGKIREAYLYWGNEQKCI